MKERKSSVLLGDTFPTPILNTAGFCVAFGSFMVSIAG